MLKGDEAALIAGAVAGWPLERIASAAGVSVSTVQRALREREIAAAVREGRAEQCREVVGRLNQQMLEAVDRLADLSRHEDPNVALRAITLILGNAHKFAVVEALERLAVLEAAKAAGGSR